MNTSEPFTASAGSNARSRSVRPSSACRNADPGSNPAVVTVLPYSVFSSATTSKRACVSRSRSASTCGNNGAIAVPVATPMRLPCQSPYRPAPAALALPVPIPPGRSRDSRLQIPHGPDAVLALLEVAIPGRLRQRGTGVEIQIVGAEAPWVPPLRYGPRGEMVHHCERGPALLTGRLAHQLVLTEFRECHGHDRNREYRCSEPVQIAQRSSELGSIVHSWNEHHLGVEANAFTPQCLKL